MPGLTIFEDPPAAAAGNCAAPRPAMLNQREMENG
jgi:hypothetical protein